jgi:hypothetical protein
MRDEQRPEPGDVLFLNSPSTGAISTMVNRNKVSHLVGRLLSGLVQKQLDPAPGNKTFHHVAIVIDGLLALEAMPAPNPEHREGRVFELPHTVEVGKWSGAELRGGVRLIPIADLVVPVMAPGGELVALRSADANMATQSTVTPLRSEIVRALGSQYSLQVLKDKAETDFPMLTRLFGRWINLSSWPSDFATRVGVETSLRESLEARFPDFVLHEAARTYFCSQFVLHYLRITGLCEPDTGTETATPSGLHQLLLDRGVGRHNVSL